MNPCCMPKNRDVFSSLARTERGFQNLFPPLSSSSPRAQQCVLESRRRRKREIEVAKKGGERVRNISSSSSRFPFLPSVATPPFRPPFPSSSFPLLIYAWRQPRKKGSSTLLLVLRGKGEKQQAEWKWESESQVSRKGKGKRKKGRFCVLPPLFHHRSPPSLPPSRYFFCRNVGALLLFFCRKTGARASADIVPCNGRSSSSACIGPPPPFSLRGIRHSFPRKKEEKKFFSAPGESEAAAGLGSSCSGDEEEEEALPPYFPFPTSILIGGVEGNRK